MPWFASNTDLTIPTARGKAPGNGALVEVVRIATGAEPQVAGKPLPPMHRETVIRTGAKRPLVVGDRLDTDIEGANAAGVDSLLVLTGVTDAALLLAAEPKYRPTYVDADLRGLLTAQPEVTAAGEAFACGGWTASAGTVPWPWRARASRWTGCGRCARRRGRPPVTGPAGWTRERRSPGWGCEPRIGRLRGGPRAACAGGAGRARRLPA